MRRNVNKEVKQVAWNISFIKTFRRDDETNQTNKISPIFLFFIFCVRIKKTGGAKLLPNFIIHLKPNN